VSIDLQEVQCLAEDFVRLGILSLRHVWNLAVAEFEFIENTLLPRLIGDPDYSDHAYRLNKIVTSFVAGCSRQRLQREVVLWLLLLQ
jgi:hypothetical protein